MWSSCALFSILLESSASTTGLLEGNEEGPGWQKEVGKLCDNAARCKNFFNGGRDVTQVSCFYSFLSIPFLGSRRSATAAYATAGIITLR